MNRLDEIVRTMENIPPYPKVAQTVVVMLQDPNVSALELAKVIQFDQAITANVLRLCNSAFFGLTRKVSSLEEALMVMGHGTLRDIVMASSSARFFKTDIKGYDLGQGELWLHAVATAIMAKQLVDYIPSVDAGLAFTTALLHDIGKICLHTFVKDDFRAIMLKVIKEQSSFVAAEMEILGTNHAELGAKILEKWEFDPQMVLAVRQHHEPDVLTKDNLSALVALSNGLIVSMGIGVGVDGLALSLQGEGLNRFDITPQMLDKCMAAMIDQLESAKELFALA